MSEPLIFPAPNVPIIGEPFKILAHYPTVVVQCSCEAKSVLVIVAAGNAVQCSACQQCVGIGHVGSVQVGVVTPTEIAQ